MVSIIMPLFNAAKYLPEALHSVLGQTYQDFELICVDDCSTDDTGKFLKEFQKKDERIKILTNQKRLGAALSRNRGLKGAQGEYVLFLDGDDIFEPELLEKAGRAMEKYQTDVVCYEYLHVPSETIYHKKVVERSERFIENYCKKPFSANGFEPREFPNWSDAPYDKMFRKKFLEENKLEFQDIPSCNDVCFAKMALFCAQKIIWLEDRRVMVYVRDHFEPSRISLDRDPMCVYYAMENLAEELYKRNLFSRLAEFFYYTFISHLLYVLPKEKKEERRKSFYDFLQKEGVPKLIAYGKGDYDKADCYDKYLLENFLNHTYESGWFYNPQSYFQFYLKKNGEVLCNFLREKQLQKKGVILWGIGRNGTILLDYLSECSLKISGIVDGDESKQGTNVGGYKIEKPEICCREADCIIVASKQLYIDVKSALGNTGIELVNIVELLTKRKDT